MLILPDSSSLGDKHLSPAERVIDLKERVRKQRQTNRVPNQDIIEDQDKALGTPLMPEEFIRRLRKLSPKIIVEQGGIPNAVAVRVLVTDKDPQSDTYKQTIKKYVSGFYVDRGLPEFSSFVNDQWGVPVREIRGWRSVLLALKAQKVVPYKKIAAEFGEPKTARGILWREQTQAERT